MKKALALVLVVSVLTGMGVFAVSATGRRSTPARASAHRVDSHRLLEELNRVVARTEDSANSVSLARVSCRSLGCINRTLTSLQSQIAAVRSYAKNTSNLLRTFLGCLALGDVTQYGDFLSTDGVNPTSGLDFTATGDVPDMTSVAWVCG